MSIATITIEAGPHPRRGCPIEFSAPESLSPGQYELTADDRLGVAAEVGKDNKLRFILEDLASGSAQTYAIARRDVSAAEQNVAVHDSGSELSISLRNELVTRYVYADVPARPYFYPLFAPGQIPVTRAFPMELDAPGETRDHPHHRSLWIAHGEVNGADNWSEETGHGYTRHEQFSHIASGSVAGSFTSRSRWTAGDGSELLTQWLTVTAWATSEDFRLLDFDIRLTADRGDVHFGDTKEGGILSVRVATEMDVPRTGTITNVYGGINEAETWGKAAHWCDYSGTVVGKSVGIAVLDHPHSFRYPTHWHVRNYGLMTANPFAYAAYTGGVKEGSHTLKAGDSLVFRYRVVLHRNSCDDAQIAGRYLDYAAPPRVTFTP